MDGALILASLALVTWYVTERKKYPTQSQTPVYNPTQTTSIAPYRVDYVPGSSDNLVAELKRIFAVSDSLKAPPVQNPAQTPPAPVTIAPRKWITPAKGQAYESLFNAASKKYGLPDGLLSRVAYQESRYNPNAINKGSNAQGMMQIVPRWHPGVDTWNPEVAIPYAAKYLAQLYKLLGSWPKALAGYNWGQGNVINKANPYGAKWLQHVPPETYNYVIAVCRDTGIKI